MLESTLTRRREYLRQVIDQIPNKVDYVVSKDANEFDLIQDFLNESVRGRFFMMSVGCEGLMVKTLIDNSAYEPCIRSYRWLKLKRDYLEQSLSDSLDLVVIAAKYGEGKRTGFFGTFLLASYNCEAERYESTGMCATGFSDEDLKNYSEALKPLVLKEPHSDVYCKEGTGSRAV